MYDLGFHIANVTHEFLVIEYGCIYGQLHIQEIWKAPVQRLKNQHSANSWPTVHGILKWGPRVENTLISQKICDLEGMCPLATDGLPGTLLIFTWKPLKSNCPAPTTLQLHW